MKKLTCAVLVGIVLLLAGPLPSHAGGTRVFIGAKIGVGGPVWGGARVWGGPPVWGPRVWGGPRVWWGAPVWGAGVWWGPPAVWGPWYPYYAAPPVMIQPPPPVYVQPAPQPQPSDWYYCQDPQGYYPYVKECPTGWTQVVPQAPPPGR